MNLFVGAYPLLIGRAGGAAELWATLATSASIRGLEVPWSPDLSAHELVREWRGLPEHWQFVLTMIPGTLGRLGSHERYGLASSDPDGAAAALADLDAVRALVAQVHEGLGRSAVTHIELHSAPRAAAGSSAMSLAASLTTAASWSWHDTQLVLEHVDAPAPGHVPAKGFLPLDDELTALEDSGVGLVINWGRSAIELRDADAVVDQIDSARRAGVLRGLMFSGVSDVDSDYGPAWSDEHLPFEHDAPASLLTLERAAKAVAVAGPDVFLGAKLSWAGHPETVSAAAAMLASAAELITRMPSTGYVAR